MNIRSKLQSRNPNRELVVGSFPVGVTGVSAAETQACAAGDALTLTVTATGTAGNALHYQSDHDADTGNGAGALTGAVQLAEDSYSFSGGTAGQTARCRIQNAQLDIMIENVTGSLGNVAANSWVAKVVPHSHLGGGVTIAEDTTNKQFIIAFEEGVSDLAAVVAAIGGATRIRLAPQWAEWDATATRVEAHYTPGTTTAQLATEINRVSSSSGVTSSAGGASALADGDAHASGHIDDVTGVNAVAVAASGIKGLVGATVTKGAAGVYTVVFSDYFPTCEFAMAAFQFGSGTEQDLLAEVISFTAATKTMVVNVLDKSTVGLTDGTYNANNRINLMAIMKRTA